MCLAFIWQKVKQSVKVLRTGPLVSVELLAARILYRASLPTPTPDIKRGMLIVFNSNNAREQI